MTAFTLDDKNILIVEDQRPFLILLRGLLNNLGAKNVTICANAEKAVSLCRKIAFDIVISDLHLGNKRKNGFELVEELRVKKWLKPSSVFILISADAARPIVIGSIERRPDEYLVKPFSQAQIKARMSRAWKKREFLTPIFAVADKGQYTQAIEVAKSLMQRDSIYQNQCLQVLVELYWKTEQFTLALELLDRNAKVQSAMWAQVAKAKTLLALKQYDDANLLANNIIKRNRFCVEAYDILAESQSLQERADDALSTIQGALKISPYSIDRQFIASQIARQTGDYKLASQTCLAIWEQSKRSVHQSPVHWCGYIRSLLDAAEHAEQKKHKHSYQQEALLTLQRSRFDEVLARFEEEFDIAVFENIVNARINAIDGKLIEAKRLITDAQFTIEQRYDDYPVVYAPDSIPTLLSVGEFEQAQSLMAKLEAIKPTLDPNTVYTIEKAKSDSSDTMGNYVKLNKQGIELYQQGQFIKAKEVFEQAKAIAPLNTGVILNLLQCILKLIKQNKNKRIDPKHAEECRSLYRVINGMSLNGQHLEKFNSLQDELMQFIE